MQNSTSLSAISLLLILSLIPFSAIGQRTPTQDIDHKRISTGQKAPFSGVLLSDKALAKIITDYEHKLKLREIDIEKLQLENAASEGYYKAICKAQLDGEASKRQSVERDLKRQKSIYETALKKNRTPWYKNPVMAFVLGQAVSFVIPGQIHEQLCNLF